MMASTPCRQTATLQSLSRSATAAPWLVRFPFKSVKKGNDQYYFSGFCGETFLLRTLYTAWFRFYSHVWCLALSPHLENIIMSLKYVGPLSS